MIKQNKNRTLIWVIVILFATNLSMGFSFLYHKQQDKKIAEQKEEVAIEMPAQQRTRFFREELNLNSEQLEKFREYNRDYNRAAMQITHQLEDLRIDMISVLGETESDPKKLDSITEEIGKQHTELKKITSDYYLKMKTVCNEEQKVKLNEIFMSMIKKNEDVKLPGGYGRNRRNFNNNN
jgi:Spy/CpxP family protein refolding chaperone